MSADTASFELRVSPGSRAVTRMLTCCLGKGLEIVELSWRAGEPEARAALTLSGDPARLARAGLWLDRLGGGDRGVAAAHVIAQCGSFTSRRCSLAFVAAGTCLKKG